MIDHIRGILTDKELSRITVEASGVGYAVSIPVSTYEKLPEAGREVRVLIHYNVSGHDGSVTLYGFASATEREIFRHLITVNSIGPSVAMGILSGVSAENLVTYVNTGNTAALKKISGVGPKTAERMVLELRDKFKVYATTVEQLSSTPSAKKSTKNAQRKDEAFAAMLSLGYNDKQVIKAIARVEQEITENAPVEEWIRMALQVI
jgi:Holliday junction DNA helicase RuvA